MKSIYSMVGMKHRGSEKLLASMRVGERLTLKRDPQNEHDRFAIKVMHNGEHIAFIKGSEAAMLAPWMDGRGRDEVPGLFAQAGRWPHVELDI